MSHQCGNCTVNVNFFGRSVGNDILVLAEALTQRKSIEALAALYKILLSYIGEEELKRVEVSLKFGHC